MNESNTYLVPAFRGSMEITTMIGCPLLCTYCPQQALKAAYQKEAPKYLNPKDFSRFLRKIPKNIEISFCGFAEAWANPDCDDMLEECLQSGYKVGIGTTFYGMKNYERTASLLDRYKDSITFVRVHLPDKNGNMLGWRDGEEWRNAYNAIMRLKLPCGVHQMTMDASGITDHKIHDLTDTTEAFQGHQRAGTLDLDQLKGQPVDVLPHHSDSIICSVAPNYNANVLLPNGDVYLCCHDYSLKHKLGNLNVNTYDELFTNRELVFVKKINAKNSFSNDSLCKTCHQATSSKNVFKFTIESINKKINHVFNTYRAEKIVLWGAGEYLMQLLEISDLNKFNVCHIYDRNNKIKVIKGIKVKSLSPDGYKNFSASFDCVLITALSSEDEIFKDLRPISDLGVDVIRLHN